MGPPHESQESAARRDGVVTPEPADGLGFELALVTDVGTARENNEDAFGFFVESPTSVVFAVADGVGGYEGGELASRMAIDATLDAYRKSPPVWGASKRLARAAQRANIEIYDRAIVVTELRRMATTLTAASVDGGVLTAVHVGDCRLYLLRDGRISQLTKDHTVAGARTRLGLLAKEKLREHPERGSLTRSLGPELIVALDRFATELAEGDTVVTASDGLYGALTEDEILGIARGRTAKETCRGLIDAANRKGTADNLTAAVFRQTTAVPEASKRGLRARLSSLLRAPFHRR